MTGALTFLAGGTLVALVFYDFLKTAIGMAGMGPLTRRMAWHLWRMLRWAIPRARARSSWRLEDTAGPLILVLVAITWITVSCLGYTLMFGAEGALLDRATHVPAEPVERIAFAGSALSTLGASLTQPGNGWWDILSMIAAIHGMVVLTLSVSFVNNVTATTASARAIALRVAAIRLREGDVPREEVLDELTQLAAPLSRVVMDLRSTPIAGYFSTNRPQINFPRSIMVLCELIERHDHPERPGETRMGLAHLRLALRELGELDATQTAGEHLAGLGRARHWAEKRIIGAQP